LGRGHPSRRGMHERRRSSLRTLIGIKWRGRASRRSLRESAHDGWPCSAERLLTAAYRLGIAHPEYTVPVATGVRVDHHRGAMQAKRPYAWAVSGYR